MQVGNEDEDPQTFKNNHTECIMRTLAVIHVRNGEVVAVAGITHNTENESGQDFIIFTNPIMPSATS